MRSKRSRATEISQKTRILVARRDEGCIFCRMGYRAEDYPPDPFAASIPEMMHFVPRSLGGLGNERNLAVGCKFHHTLYDNGNKGLHGEMKEFFREYLMEQYPDWDEADTVFNKWAM